MIIYRSSNTLNSLCVWTLQTPCRFLHALSMRKGLGPFKTVLWKSARRNPCNVIKTWTPLHTYFGLFTTFSEHLLSEHLLMAASIDWRATKRNPVLNQERPIVLHIMGNFNFTCCILFYMFFFYHDLKINHKDSSFYIFFYW